MADKAAAPVIGLLDCGGFRLQESVDALDSFGCVLAKQAEYADSVLQISAVMGNCAGGMTLIPAMSDFAFMTKEAQMYVNAPHTIQDNKKAFPASLILQNIRRQFPDRQKYWRAKRLF